MKQRLTVVPVILMLLFAPLVRVHARQQANDAKAASVKADITRRVAHNKAHIKIKMRDGARLNGRVEQAGDKTFAVKEDNTGKRIEVAYGDVDQVKGQGLGKGAKIGIIAGVAVGALAIAVVIALRNFDPFKH